MSRVMEGVDRLTRIAGQNRLELLLFGLGTGQRFGINVFKVREVLKCPGVRRIPQADPHVRGVMHTRGQTVTIIDLAWFLLGSSTKVNMRSRLLLASLRGRPVGLLVDEVLGQRNFVETDASAAPIDEDNPLHGYVKRQYRAGSETWQELDLDILFTTADFLNGAAS